MEKQQIVDKKKKLDELTVHLKNKFFGIDDEIDKIIDSLKSWYIIPEILTHPIIINLWSLTGNGKTDLVRTIVDYLNFNENFCEVQLSDVPVSINDTAIDKISTLILRSGCKEGSPGIILFDEFQRYRTIDNSGQDARGLPYQDIWMLLSDGRFPVDDKKHKNYKKLIKQLGFEWKCVEIDQSGNVVNESTMIEYDEHLIRGRKFKSKKIDNKIDYLFLPRTSVKYFSGMDDKLMEDVSEFLDHTFSENEISTWTYLETVDKITDYYKNRASTYDFSKCLIFVAGNLDEAFQVAGDVDNCDTDADIFREYTKNVSIIEIKKALTNRFKPEQISRLGNNHIIYPSLDRKAYLKIIEKTCNSYLEKAEVASKKKFILDETVVQEIYENSVYPTQGTRPVFSSIHMMLTAPLSNGILWATENHVDVIRIKIFTNQSCISFIDNTNEDKKLCVPIQFQIRDRKNRNTDNFSAMVAVHEMGHAIVHAELFKEAPKEVKINVASFNGGYNRFECKYSCADDILDRICVYFGGIVAEEIIFGENKRSTGSATDITWATDLAGKYVRCWSMDDVLGYVSHDAISPHSTIRNLEKTDEVIMRILKEQKKRATAIVGSYKTFLIDASKKLIEKKQFSQQEFIEYSDGIFDFSNNQKNNSKIDTHTKYYDILMNQ